MIFTELLLVLTILFSVVGLCLVQCVFCRFGGRIRSTFMKPRILNFEFVLLTFSKPTFDLRVDRQFNFEFACGLQFTNFLNTNWECFSVMLAVFVWIATLQQIH